LKISQKTSEWVGEDGNRSKGFFLLKKCRNIYNRSN